MLGQLLGRKNEARGSALARSVAALTSGIAGSLVERFRAAAEDLLRQAASLGIRAAAAAALAVAAVVLLLTGIKEGLVALGLPDWAASLGLAVLGGLAGWLVLRRPSPDARAAREEPASGALTLRIIREDRRVPPAGEGGAEAPVIDVHPAPEGWEVTAPRSARGPATFRTKREALRAARRAARRRGGGRIVVHRSDGTVQRSRRRPPA